MDVRESINIFERAATASAEEADQWKKENNGKVMGFMLTDVPEELLHAAGFLPFAVNSVAGRLECADAHLQAWACSYSRNCLAAAAQGKLSFLDGLVIPHTCDTMRMLMGVWEQIQPLPFMKNYRLPRQVARPSAGIYLHGELQRLKGALENFRGQQIKDDALRESIALYNSNRSLLRHLYRLHESTLSPLSSKDLFTIIKAAMVMPREKVNLLLKQLLACLEEGNTENCRRGDIRLLISGTLLEPLQLLDFISEKGGIVVADDLQNGSRYLVADVAESGDPLEALAERQLTRIPTALYEPQKQNRMEYLANLAREQRADGVLFVHLKFCEPENYDYYDNVKAMEKAGIPAMAVESSFGGVHTGQLQTRVHAFMEMLGGEGTD
ncbi:MAG TPA: hypothetical protein DCQ14_06790 [Firmicutes bacterium]|nr:hypothetical protein [Bacillota bacterium]